MQKNVIIPYEALSNARVCIFYHTHVEQALVEKINLLKALKDYFAPC